MTNNVARTYSYTPPYKNRRLHFSCSFVLLVPLFFALPCRAADAGDDFSNNLFSDLAPLLTLFGEQVAKQFLSQSLHWLDNVIFAMAPLGIITGMVSAIRVGGPRWLRAVIGRARESKGDAEVELMSSTSADVCELWNGDTVVRTLGAPAIVEIVFLEKIEEANAVAGGSIAPYLDEPVTGEARSDVADDGFVEIADHVIKENGKGENNLGQIDSASTLVDDEHAGVFTFDEAEKVGLFSKVGGETFSAPSQIPFSSAQEQPTHVFELEDLQILPQDGARPASRHSSEVTEAEDLDMLLEESGLLRDDREEIPSAPNISLNAGISQGTLWELAVVAVTGTILQIGVLAFSGTITYKLATDAHFLKDGRRMAAYAFPLTAIGTVLVTIGMYLCAMVVQNRSIEAKWAKVPIAAPPGYRIRTAWLQKAQVVTDQAFPPCVIMAPADGRYHLTSRPDPSIRSQHTSVVLGAFISVIGFVSQFSGLRAMHFSATLAQLGATLIMTVLRILVRRQLSLRPAVETVAKAHELEWMTRRITRCQRWHVLPVPTKSSGALGGSSNDGEKDDHKRAGFQSFKVRTRLSTMAQWEDDALLTPIVDSIISAVEGAFNYLYNSSVFLKPQAADMDAFCWYLHVGAAPLWDGVPAAQSFEEAFERIGILMTRTRRIEDGKQVWGGWKLNRAELEAAVALWFYDIREQEDISSTRNSVRDDTKAIFFLGRNSAIARLDYETFIGRGTKLMQFEQGVFSHPIPMHRKFGFCDYSKPSASHIAVNSFSNTEDLCKRHIFAAFFAQASRLIQNLSGTNTLRRNPDSNDNQSFRLENSNLRQLTEVAHNAGLGTPEEILMALVPPLRHNGNLLRASNAFDVVVDQLKQMGDTVAAEALEHRLFYLCEELVNTLKREHHWDITSDYVFGLASAFKNAFGEHDRRTARASSLLKRFCETFTSVVKFHMDTLQDDAVEANYVTLKDIMSSAAECFGPASDIIKQLEQLEAKVQTFSDLHHPGLPSSMEIAAELPAEVPRHLETKPQVSIQKYNKSELLPKYSFVLPLDFPRDLLRCIASNNFSELLMICKAWDDASAWTSGDSSKFLQAAFMLAAALNQVEICRYFLEWKLATPDPHLLDHSVCGKVLQIASRHGLASIIDVVIELMPEALLAGVIEYAQSEPLLSPLQLACEAGNFEIVNLLILAGADKNADPARFMRINPDGPQTSKVPVVLAAIHGYDDILSLLLFHGANGNVIDKHGNSILHHAALAGHKPILDVCIKHGLGVLHSSNAVEETPLHLASRNAHLDCVTCLASAGVDIDARDENGFAPLHIATTLNHFDLVNLLLDLGADINARDRTGQTAFHLAVAASHKRIVELLISRGAEVEEVTYSGATPLISVIDNGVPSTVVDMVSYLVSHHHVNVNARDYQGRAALHLAAGGQHREELLVALLNAGADLSLADTNGRNPVHFAAMNGNVGSLKILLSSRKNLDIFGNHLIEDDENNDADNYFCIKRRDDDVLNVLDALNSSPLAEAISCEHWQCALWLLSYGAKGLYTKTGNRSLLQMAIRVYLSSQQGGVAEYLLSLQTDNLEDEPNTHGDTSNEGFWETLQSLLDAGTDVNHIDDDGWSALYDATALSSDRECSIAMFLLKNGADVNLKGRRGETPLFQNAQKSLINGIDFLLKHGASVDERNDFGDTPLMALLKTCISGSFGGLISITDEDALKAIDLLLDAGAMIECQSLASTDASESVPSVGPTTPPLFVAVDTLRLPLVQRLVKRGADCKVVHNGDTVLLHIARSKKMDPYSDEVISFILEQGVDVEQRDTKGRTALSWAIINENIKDICSLLNHGATVDDRCIAEDGLSIVHYAAAAKSSLILTNLVAHNPNLQLELPTKDGTGRTASHIAADSGNVDLLEFLYHRDAEFLDQLYLFAKDSKGYTCLHYGIHHKPVIEYLVGNLGMDPDEKQGPKGRTAIHSAIALLRPGEEFTPGVYRREFVQDLITVSNISQCITTLLLLGAKDEATDDDGKSPANYIESMVAPLYPDEVEKLRRLFRYSDLEVVAPPATAATTTASG